ncbi:MAG: glycerol-3-phosphate 1-O-acyltransferase PlsY [Clostridiales Family XIII bacterium]|jgi:glycerol-3-phosphate acyltransferase PlsY|nr:glycerol-3-phosphate 1-O-acyltransferase PlsY [Clostridiales Family XIII bacterium]
MQAFIEQLTSLPIPWPWLIPIAAASYFAGNINPAIILGRMRGVDVRAEGSGNAGTTNALRTLGKKSGAIVFAVDVLKGVIVALLAAQLLSLAAGMVCGICVILGHLWPAVFGFRGGKGVATTFGVLLAVQPLLALLLIAIVIIIVALTRMVSLGVCLAALAAVPLGLLFGSWYPAWMAVVAALVLVKHRSNIGRIIRGEESKLSFGTRERS